MQVRSYKRLRDALLDHFASMVIEHGLAPIRTRAAKTRLKGSRRAKRQSLPPGDLVVGKPACVVVLDVGRQDGAASILRCWHHLAKVRRDLKQRVILFYIAIVRHPRGDCRTRLPWAFTYERVRGDLGPAFEAYSAECTRPPWDPRGDIPQTILKSCLDQLDEQGVLEKIEALLGGDVTRRVDLTTFPPPGCEAPGRKPASIPHC